MVLDPSEKQISGKRMSPIMTEKLFWALAGLGAFVLVFDCLLIGAVIGVYYFGKWRKKKLNQEEKDAT